MAEQSLAEANSKNKKDEFPREFIEQRLLESLNSLYESSRIAKDISAEETKLANFMEIKNKLTHDDHRPVAALENIDNNINSVKRRIENLKSNMDEAQKKVVKGFHDILTSMMDLSEKKAAISSGGFQTALGKLNQKITSTFSNQIENIDKKVEALKKTKLNVSEKDKLTKMIEEIQPTVINSQKDKIASVSQATDNQLKTMEKRVEEKINSLDYNSVTEEVQKKITGSLQVKMKEHLELTNQSIAKWNQQPLSDTMKEYVQSQITEHIGPVNLQKLIIALPEYQLLKQMLENKEAGTRIDLEQSPEFQSMKSVISSISNELTQLKQVTNSTRSVVEVMKKNNLPVQAMSTTFDYAASVKHIETMEREINLMYDSIKKTESEAETSMNGLHVSTSRKRARLDNPDSTIKTEVLSRLDEVEKKQQKLQDYVFQCKDTVLDDDFPTRLDAAMKRIQHILLNHETFISFLIDPITTAGRIKETVGDNIDHTEKLNPSILTSISQLIQKTAEEISTPLQKRIKLLEEKLDQQN